MRISVMGQCAEILGDEPPTCPWRALELPEVRDVLDAYRACATGLGLNVIGLKQTNPPRYVWEGLQHYVHALNLIRDWDDEQRDKNKPPKR